MISYAQNFEDVMIARLFPRDHKGFYIDIGAADPAYLSVTKHFYDAGWNGINVEPLTHFHQRLTTARPRDVNIQAIVGRAKSSQTQTFFEIAELPENSTSDLNVMKALRKEGRTIREHNVPVISLQELCERHAAGRNIDFMKIDVEGGELEVLKSADWKSHRPVLLIIEAVVVNGRDETWPIWEYVLTEQSYVKVWFDGLNNYYLREESMHLSKKLCLPPNVFDQIELAGAFPDEIEGEGLSKGIEEFNVDRAATKKIVERLATDLTTANEDRIAKQEALDRLIIDLNEANSDRIAKQAVVERLVTDLIAANADREAKQEVLDRLIADLNNANADRIDKQRVILELEKRAAKK